MHINNYRFKVAKLFFAAFTIYIACPHVKCGDLATKDNSETTAVMEFVKAIKMWHDGDLEDACDILKNLMVMYPESIYAKKSEVFLVYAYYVRKKYRSARSTGNAFIHDYPSSPFAPYVAYITAASYYQAIPLVTINNVNALEARDAFKRLKENYPGTKYQTLTNNKIQELNDYIEYNDVHIAKSYQVRGHHIACVVYGLQLLPIISEKPQSKYTGELYYRIIVSLLAMRLPIDAGIFLKRFKTYIETNKNLVHHIWYHKANQLYHRYYKKYIK